MRSWIRVLLALPIGLALVLPASPLRANSGRDPYRCLVACRNIKNACDTQCGITCSTLFPNNFEDRYACISNCLKSCADAELECADACRIDRPPVTPSDP